MEHESYVRQDGKFRYDEFRMTLKGRRRELVRTGLIVLLLFLAQYPLREAAQGNLESVHDFGVVVPGRLSLLLDVLMVIAYVLFAFRAFGLVRFLRPGQPWIATLNRVSAWVVGVGGALDALEDLRLWQILGETDARGHDLSLTFTQALGWLGVRSEQSYSALMFASVVVGLILLVVTTVLAYLFKQEPEAPTSPKAGSGSKGSTVICCSGGGIRSAAFCLGALEQFDAEGIYEKADAVVGVSGGGYMGAAFHVLRWQPHSSAREVAEEWPEVGAPAPYAPSSPELQWLRRHTRYVLNSLRVATQGALSLAFGLAVNLLLIVAAIGGAAWVLGYVMLASGRLHSWESVGHHTEDGRQVPDYASGFASDWWFVEWIWLVPAAGVALFVLEKLVDRFQTTPYVARKWLRLLSAPLILGGGAATALLLGVPALLAAAAEYAATSGSSFAGLVHSLELIPTSECQRLLDLQSACGVPVDKDIAAAPASRLPGVSIATIITSVLAVLASVKGTSSAGKEGGSGLSGLPGKVWAKVKDPVVPWAAVVAVVIVGVLFLLRWVAQLTAEPARLERWHYALVFAALILAAKILTDANRTSLHHFFRERISYAFFVRRQRAAVEPVPYRRPLRFSEAAPPPGKGPQLVSAAVANVTDEELVPSRRGCVPFVFGHDRIGLTDRLLPESAARRSSATYEFAADPFHRDATIPAAIAMSAAAFSPLAGRENVRLGPYRAVLALANARLGVWLPNPLWTDEGRLVRRLVRLGRISQAARVVTEVADRAADPYEALELTDDHRARLEPAVAKRQKLAETIAQLTACLRGALERNEGPEVIAAKKAAVVAAFKELQAYDATPVGKSWQRGFVATWEAGRTIFKKPGLTRLLKEAVGKASVFDRFLYVTDGGHYDNLGLIEALRRRPEAIYVVDASNDPEDTFRTLGRAIATARMDLDCKVTLDPRAMRRLEEPRSRAAWCAGTFEFDDDPDFTGTIFLVKAIMLDNLGWDLETYARDNIAFPRTSTNNQLYSEFDFEAYRALGAAATEGMLGSVEHLAFELRRRSRS